MHSRALGAAAAPARVVPGASSKTRPPAARPARPPRGWRDDSPLAPPEDARARKNKKKSRRERQRDRVFAEEVKGGDGDGKGDASSAVLRTVDLGQGKSVALYVPSDVADVAGDRIARENLERFRDALYGAGDVVWPASIALARLVSHCPSLVAGKRVLEIGAGLGLVGNAAAKAGAAEVLMVDLDADVLQLARRSVPENIPEDPSLANVETLDWDDVPDDWPADRFDVVLAADVLYDDDAARGVADVVARALRAGDGGEGGAMALVCDPEQREHRDAFANAATTRGLETVAAEFPGHAGMRLVQTTRVDIARA